MSSQAAVWLLDNKGEAFASSDTRQAPLGRTYARTPADSFAVSATGSSTTLAQARKLGKAAAGFDADGYKILCRPILAEELPIVPL